MLLSPYTTVPIREHIRNKPHWTIAINVVIKYHFEQLVLKLTKSRQHSRIVV